MMIKIHINNYTNIIKGGKMKKLLMLSILLPMYSFAGGWAVGYSNVGDSDVSLGALSGSYQWDHENNFSTEVGLWTGIKDDSLNETVEGIDITGTVEMDLGGFIKFKYNMGDLHASFIWADLAGSTVLAANTPNGAIVSADSASGSETGLGLGYNIGNFVISFDKFDEFDSLNFQYKF